MKSDNEVLAWLMAEYEQPFEGWDFSYLEGRRIHQDAVPWDYNEIAIELLGKSNSVLDVDTGGGELFAVLLEKSVYRGRVYAIETHAPNVPIACHNLAQFSPKMLDGAAEAIDRAGSFDLILNRHGGSLSLADTLKLMTVGGAFVTQQVGDKTNQELRELFEVPSTRDLSWPRNEEDARRRFTELGFTIRELASHDYLIRFVDVGAVVYYLKAIPWEVPDFTVEGYADVLLRLHHQSKKQGYALHTTFHTYLAVLGKP